MTITLQIHVPDTGEHTVLVAVTERPEDPYLTDQHIDIRREIYEVNAVTQTATRIK